ncbi:AAA domain-containing protein [Paraburkholderia sp. RL17-381-BIF-C]|uniref:AAA domain-containing protein n=1 Tax=Paraburkholderia sp. RL17-381-BIF-C TaxID=3031635 RepID=UPI0038BC19A0
MNENDTVLNARYSLTRRIDMPGVQSAELWEAMDREGEFHTLKITPYVGDKPPSEVRRMWDNDLRVMYRLSSSAGASGQLVVMKDAGIDSTKRAMVLVYEGWQHITFAQILKDRERVDWLSFKALRERYIRRELWHALMQVAKGLQSLHNQDLIHRNVTPEAIWGRRGEGPESLRLSGFDWSARIGHVANTSERSPWATPPELKQVGYSFASDWYGFGTTVARCFHKVEHLSNQPPDALATALSAAISRENPCNLEPLERDFVKAITAPDRIDRLQRAAGILESIERIIEALDFGHKAKNDGRRVLLYLDHKNPQVVDAAQRAGFTVNPDDPFEAFDPVSASHKVRLKDFLADQLRNAALSWSIDGRRFELKCCDLFVMGERWMNYGDSTEPSWKAAKSYLNTTTRLFESTPAQGFENVHIEVEFDRREVGRRVEPGSGYAMWNAFSPKGDANHGLEQDSENLRQFLHASNQFEILLRDAELFKYKIVSQEDQGGSTTIIIAPVDEDRPSRQYFKADRKMTDFLQQEWDSAKPDCEKVLLTDSDSLFVSRAGASLLGERFEVDKEQWTIADIDQDQELVTLFRQNSPAIAPPSSEGYLRTRGHYGQIRLIERRKESIDRLASHAYLLRTLASPGFTPIDAGASELPWPRIEEGEIIDGNKLAIVRDTLRMRPMYALQGPPGTGKSTLVAHLLRQILEDDPMAQILVTAKDHAAVDVLLNKVIRQAYKDAPEEEHPLAIRLNRRDGNNHARELVDKLMRTAISAIRNRTQQTVSDPYEEYRDKWLRLLEASCSEGDEWPENLQAFRYSLLELVQRGASITYCTTSSGDLEELAKGAHSFDWSIIEEAGKTHGFDLALPLQAGHRWLLLGDHKQLRPFLYEEFSDCFNRLAGSDAIGDGVIDTLEQLGNRPGNARLIDIEWLKAKFDADPNWVNSFANFARGWLASFAKVFEDRRKLNDVTQVESIGASAGLLTSQYRMPPVVGDLNSTVFYKGDVGNATADAEGRPNAEHRNPFVAPDWLAEKSLVWLDIPWVEENKEARKKGYANTSERRAISRLLQMTKVADASAPTPYTIAILTPYNMQKLEINRSDIMAPAGCQFGSAQELDPGKYKAYSVDSFQGNEADIIVVSLVRNKLQAQGLPAATDIKFITQPDRLNVMLSRSRRLLVIVGCWEYISACVAAVSSATDAQGNYNDPDFGPFKKTLEELDAMFKDGRASKISVETLQ